MLRAHLDALLPAEAILTRWQEESSLLADWHERRRLPALLADLDALDFRPDTARPVGNPTRPTESEIAGMLYVLEGSRLGGRVLARQIPTSFPAQYLNANQVSGKWRELLDKIDSILYQSRETGTAIDAALALFSKFEAAGSDWQTNE